LLILRHGKAAPEEAGSDRDRPLTKHGKRAAEHVGQRLRDEDLVPDRIISSKAQRASDTAHRVAVAAGFRGPLDELEELYLAEPEPYITALRLLAGDSARVLVVGHNPGLEALVMILTGEGVALPTAGLAVCSLPISNFAELSAEVRGKLTQFIQPKTRDA